MDTGWHSLSGRQRKVLLAMLLGISFLYYISACYINTSNDGSHYALVSAMANKHTVCINDYVSYTGKMDYAVKDGQYYSDRLPGNAFLMLPFFMYGKGLEALHLERISGHVPIEEVTVILESVICGVLGVLFLFLIFRFFGSPFQTALGLSAVYAVCTLNWQEATHVFSHAASMCFVLGAFYFLLKARRIYEPAFLWFVFLLSYASIIELQNMLLFIPAALYGLATQKVDWQLKARTARRLGLSALIFGAVISALLIYNHTAFGEWMLKSNKYNPEFPEEGSFFTSLSGDALAGLDRLFTNFGNPEVRFQLELGVKNDTPGLFITSPLLLLSLWGFVLFVRQYPREALLVLGIIVINVAIAAFHQTVIVRHIFTITPFLFLPIVFVARQAGAWKPAPKALFWLVFVTLAGISCFRVFYVTHTYWGRELSNLFPFAKELPVYLIFVIWTGLVVYLCRLIRKRKTAAE